MLFFVLGVVVSSWVPYDKDMLFSRRKTEDEAIKKDAFDRLLDRYLNNVYNFVFRIVGEKEAAEDIVQETFFKVWKRNGAFESEIQEKSFLFTVARNTSFDWLKRKKNIPFSRLSHTDEEGNTVEFDSASDEPLPDELFARSEMVEYLDRALRKLSEADRALLLLVYREDFSLREAADILGESYNTIKSRHQRALRKLKRVLQEDLPAPKTVSDSL